MEAVTWLHGTAGLVLLGAAVILAAATLLALRFPAASQRADTARRVLLGLLVAEAALGLTVALRGGAPAENVHWLYGFAVIGVLLVSGSVSNELARRRDVVAAVGATLAAFLAWRLWGSG